MFDYLVQEAADRAVAGAADASESHEDASTTSSSTPATQQQAVSGASAAELPAAALEGAEPTIGLAFVAALCRHVTGAHAPAKLQALLAGVPRTGPLPEAVDAAGFAAAVRQMCAGAWDTSRRLADVLAPVLAGRVELDTTAHLAPAFAAHVRRQPLHAWVPPIAPAAVAALSERPDVCEVLLLDCRTDEEYEARLTPRFSGDPRSALAPARHRSPPHVFESVCMQSTNMCSGGARGC